MDSLRPDVREPRLKRGFEVICPAWSQGAILGVVGGQLRR